MHIKKFIQKAGFVLKLRSLATASSYFRKVYYGILGMKVGKRTKIPKLFITWPHQIMIGKNCQLEQNIFFKYDGVWSKGPSIIIGDNVFLGANCEFNISEQIIMGKDCMIASGCKFIDHNHSTELLPKNQRMTDTKMKIHIGEDVWLGVNVVVLMGVHIGDSAIVAAGAVVTKSIPPNEIWGGIPARKIGERR